MVFVTHKLKKNICQILLLQGKKYGLKSKMAVNCNTNYNYCRVNGLKKHNLEANCESSEVMLFWLYHIW